MASRFDSGSSMQKTFGLAHDGACPIATRCRWPPDSFRGPAVEQLPELEDPVPPRRPAPVISTFGTPVFLCSANAMFSRRAHVGVERVRLEDHRDVALARAAASRVDVPVDADRAGGPPAPDPPASAASSTCRIPDGPTTDQELAIGHLQVETVDGGALSLEERCGVTASNATDAIAGVSSPARRLLMVWGWSGGPPACVWPPSLRLGYSQRLRCHAS